MTAKKRRTPARIKPVKVTLELIAPVVVSAGSLPDGSEFDYNGRLYRRLYFQADKIVGLDLKETEWLQQMRYKAFDLSTLVIPK